MNSSESARARIRGGSTDVKARGSLLPLPLPEADSGGGTPSRRCGRKRMRGRERKRIRCGVRSPGRILREGGFARGVLLW